MNRMMSALVVVLLLPGCEIIQGLFQEDTTSEDVEAAAFLLQSGDLPGASAAYEAAAIAHPNSVDAVSGAAMMAMMRGDLATADSMLAEVEGQAGERIGEVRLRRAMIAAKLGEDFDQVWRLGVASGMPVGFLLAGEAALVNGEREEARAFFAQIESDGAVGTTAGTYIALIDDSNQLVAGLSESQALWALGQRGAAVRSVADLLPRYPTDRPDRNQRLLSWASRAATVNRPKVGRSLLKAMDGAPAGQKWRKKATRALLLCAEGKGPKCVKALDKLENTAPADGLADARVTAAYIIGPDDPATAKELAGRYRSNAAAQALYRAGKKRAAQKAAPDGPFRTFLEEGG
jgi:hypothetical protein